jgi:hypothetical protein
MPQYVSSPLSRGCGLSGERGRVVPGDHEARSSTENTCAKTLHRLAVAGRPRFGSRAYVQLTVAASEPTSSEFLNESESAARIRGCGFIEPLHFARPNLAARDSFRGELVPGSYFTGRETDRPASSRPTPRDRAPGVSHYWPFPPRVCVDPAVAPALSDSRDANRGPEPTIKVGFARRNFDPKLSESLLNNPSPFNNPVGFGARSQREPE